VHFCHTRAVQVWTKLTLGFALTGTLIIGAYGIHQLRQEERDLRDAAERELRLLGEAVSVAAGNALRDRQQEDLHEILEAVKLRDPSTDVIVFDPSGDMIASRGTRATEQLARGTAAEARAASRTVVQFEGPGGLAHLIGAFPIRDDDGSGLGVLVIVRPTDALRLDLAAETRATALSLLTLLAGVAAAGWVLSTIYVRRPLLALVRTMRAVRSGDLSARAAVHASDELGAAVGEFNTMVDELLETRQRLSAEAESRVALEASLQRADKLVTVGQLSAGLAHEIGSPLQIVNGRARALAAKTDLPEDVHRTAEILARESDRITHIVEQLLTFSRRSVPSMADIDVAGPVRDIIELFEPEARRQDVRLDFAQAESLPTANADAGQVQQVVMNLLSNAVHATPRGGQVRVALEPSSFALPDGSVQAAVSLVVEDTGEGIPEEVLPYIFEPFFTTRRQGDGTGLGLAVVRSIVESHGGTLTVVSHPGAGTKVTAQFPTSRAARAGGRVA
jgi:two-component system, NtrC family, sensor histidine kinase HydH